ncbi:sigma-54 interaction domain-containing protein [Acidithiobacillus sulfuriphilus]|uniref:sigma-54 interaction domain-containing protein n=1 Tax=Acidithiobacillus sulfuriphilus TaxID=1867749 RepID=UPI003F6091D3
MDTMTDTTTNGLQISSVLDMHENPMVLIDEYYRIVAANHAYQEAYGVLAADIVGRHCHEISHHSPAPCHQRGEDCPHQAVFSTGQAHEVRHVHFDPSNRAEHVRIRGHAIMGLAGQRYLGEEIIRLADQDEVITCGEMQMVGRSPAFLRCLHHIEMAARTEASILLHGESGVGKELAASAVHHFSARQRGPFITVDCTSLPDTLFESEMLGHERGAFTGCLGRKRGLFETADGGTLFLDEIGELPLAMQAKFLRVLESGSFRRLGGAETLHADVRVVVATNRNLREMVAARSFRADLYYRLAAISISLPPLRERREDIPGIARVLLQRIGASWGGRWELSREAEIRLCAYDFPGNVRELRNILQKAAALAAGPVILVEDLDLDLEDGRSNPSGPIATVRCPTGPTHGRPGPAALPALLQRFGGNRRRVADAMGVSERTVYRWLRQG